MNVNTGKIISEIAHIKQSITNILTTPIGSRIMRRDYGSRLFERIDQPINGDLIAEIYSDVVEALFIWEPRFEVEQVTVQSIEKGKITIDLEGSFVKDGQKIDIENISITSSQMGNFTAIDLSKLPAPKVIEELSYEEIFQDIFALFGQNRFRVKLHTENATVTINRRSDRTSINCF